MLCWLCTLSFKRALAKTKKTEAEMKQLVKKRDGFVFIVYKFFIGYIVNSRVMY